MELVVLAAFSRHWTLSPRHGLLRIHPPHTPVFIMENPVGRVREGRRECQEVLNTREHW